MTCNLSKYKINSGSPPAYASKKQKEGLTHDWRFDAGIVRSVPMPVIVAGVPGPGNVAECIRQVRPFGVDSLTKTTHKDQDGIMEKDILKVIAFCRNADKAAAKIEGGKS
ncbi:MAG: hypothetical protein K5922_01415 [Clostridiales bacterium]|nr:hypothetical protein [Clostridiales bacterium]